MRNYSISSKEITSLHNANCYLQNSIRAAKEVLNDNSSILKSLEECKKYFMPIAERLMKLEDEAFERRYKIADAFRKEHNLKSMFSLDFEGLCDFAKDVNDKKLPLKFTMYSFYSEKTVEYESSVAATYQDVWLLADQLINTSSEHVFIEGFRVDEDHVEVFLGS